MARKKEKDEKQKRLSASFTFGGKRYFVKGTSKRDLDDKIFKKKTELINEKENTENPTLENYYETFTENRRRRVKESTIRSQLFQFRNCADIVIDPKGNSLGSYRLQDIRPDDIQLVQNKLAESGRSTTTVNNSIDHLRHVFNQAVRSRYISSNPCDAVQNIKRTEAPARETIHRALTVEETKAFFTEAKKSGSDYYNHFAVMIKTGIRVGELAAITAADVDRKTNELTINKTLSRDEIGGFIISNSPKTDAGNRVLPVTDEVIKIIKDQRKKNIENPLFKSDMREIFRTPEAALLREYPINREINRICKKAGIEKFTCHAFRATFATRWIEQQSERYKDLSEYLGHANTKITLDLYAHSLKETKRNAINAVTIAI